MRLRKWQRPFTGGMPLLALASAVLGFYLGAMRTKPLVRDAQAVATKALALLDIEHAKRPGCSTLLNCWTVGSGDGASDWTVICTDAAGRLVAACAEEQTLAPLFAENE